MQHLEALLAKMGLREKAGQMTQVTLDTICYGEPYQVREPLEIDSKKLDHIVRNELVGSILNVGTYAHHTDRWRELISQIQDKAKETRLGIPILYGIDTIHGANFIREASLFPQQLGLASGANTQLVEGLYRLAAEETVQAGIPWLFSPVADVGRHSAWPRLWEGFGEDSFLTEQLTSAAVRGIEKTEGAISCLKHFVGYGAAYSGKDRTPAYLHERQVREAHLPPFVAGIKAGAKTMMVNSSELNGLPLHVDPYWLDTVLRGELGFEGLLVTDWEDILYLHDYHKVADSYRSAVKLAIDAGIDMSMTPVDTEFAEHIVSLVESGELTEERIDQSVLRILKVKQDSGLFEQPLLGPKKRPSWGVSKPYLQQAAAESIVLLRNESDLLPLDKNQQLLVCGPSATSLRSMHGGWTYTWQGERTDELAPKNELHLLAAIQEEFGAGQVDHFAGCDFEDGLELDGFEAAAAKADTIILCLGESSYTEFFGSIDDLYLSAAQEGLAKACVASGKPVVLVLLQGRPRLISRFETGIGAIATAFYPGHGGGWAFAKMLTGEVNPSGRLPITYPRYPNGLLAYDHKLTENRPLQGVPAAFNPQFEFGHGLSYSQLKYEDLTVKVEQPTRIYASIRVSNLSPRPAGHIVQLFLSDHYASITPAVKRLKGVQRIHLAAQESKLVEFELGKEALEFVGINCQRIVEPGTFSIEIGGLKADFEIQ